MIEPETESPPLREIAYRRLREDIIACRLAPGQRFTERQLAAELGLGVSPIREALTRLDHEGLVRTLPRKGYQVKPLTIKTVDDLFGYWGFLGPELVRRGVLGATPEQIQQVKMCFAKLAALFSEEMPAEELTARALRLMEEAFMTLAEGTHNDYLIATFQRLSSEMARVWVLIMDASVVNGENLAQATRWPEILDRRDAEAAAEIARQYVQQSHNRVLRALARWPSIVTAEIVPLNRADTTAGPWSLGPGD